MNIESVAAAIELLASDSLTLNIVMSSHLESINTRLLDCAQQLRNVRTPSELKTLHEIGSTIAQDQHNGTNPTI